MWYEERCRSDSARSVLRVPILSSCFLTIRFLTIRLLDYSILRLFDFCTPLTWILSCPLILGRFYNYVYLSLLSVAVQECTISIAGI